MVLSIQMNLFSNTVVYEKTFVYELRKLYIYILCIPIDEDDDTHGIATEVYYSTVQSVSTCRLR